MKNFKLEAQGPDLQSEADHISNWTEQEPTKEEYKITGIPTDDNLPDVRRSPSDGVKHVDISPEYNPTLYKAKPYKLKAVPRLHVHQTE